MDNRYNKKVLASTDKTYKYIGQCKKCNKSVKIESVYENDRLCCECQFFLHGIKLKHNIGRQ